MQHILIINRLSSVICPLSSVICHLSSVLTSTTVENPLQINLFLQNKPNFPDTQMNLSSFPQKAYEIFTPLAGYKNKPNSNPNKPNSRKAKMDVNLTLTKDYRKKDDFIVRINKPNFFKGPKCTQIYMSQRIMKIKPPSGPKKQTQNKPNFFKGQNELNIACQKIRLAA